MPQETRWKIVEYDAPVDIVSDISARKNLSRSRVIELLQNAGERVATILRLGESPLSVTMQGVRSVDFAGLLRVAPGIELEIVPKFLGGASTGWREDFFFLAMLSRHGRLLSSERLRALATPNADLATLVGRAVCQMYWDNHRRPIRTYRTKSVRDFALEGDLDLAELHEVEEDGFNQRVMLFERNNEFNSTISTAARILVPLVRDPEVRSSLERITHVLGRQDANLRRPKNRVPSRAVKWQSTYELALDVMQGFGMTYDNGSSKAPGFIVDSWRVWEDLLTCSLRASLGGRHVTAQQGISFGNRQKHAEGSWSSNRAFNVIPDLRIDGAKKGFGNLIVDAKYKGRWDKGNQRISEADAYEAFAFAKAASAKRVVLIYPAVAAGPVSPVGTTRVLERITVDDCEIWGMDVEVRGISQSGGMKRFGEGLVGQLAKIDSATN